MLSSFFALLSGSEWIMVLSNLMFWQAIGRRTTTIYCCSIITITALKWIFKF